MTVIPEDIEADEPVERVIFPHSDRTVHAAPSSERLYLHRAFINWIGSNVFKRTEISEDLLL